MHHNFIRMVRVDDAEIINHARKTSTLTNYFTSIIGVTGTSVTTYLDSLYVGRAQPSTSLTADFTKAETKLALLSMNRNSAPGLDGFGPAFYKVAWATVKVKIMELMAAFHCGGAQLERINHSHMVLIPKKPGAVDVDAFRPIYLQNCSLKILSKVLTRRLQDDIPNLIDLRQMGFIKGRSISDTFVYAADLVQVCHKRKMPAVVLKLDFAKAFETVNWDGMFRVMQARGFSELGIN